MWIYATDFYTNTELLITKDLKNFEYIHLMLGVKTFVNSRVKWSPMVAMQTLNDSGKMNDITILAKPFGYPSLKQKSCKANAQANAICSTFAFAQPHPNNKLYPFINN